ncbi:MAG: DciA family protein [Phycisphaerales bacterium]
MGSPTPLQRIEQLRKLRVRGTPDLSMRADAETTLRELKKQLRTTGSLGERWASLVPPALANVTSPGRLTRGTLTITARDAAARYELERWLAAGGEESIRANVKGVRALRVTL